MELLLVRHALPLRRERADGSPADPPLSERGREEARRLAAWWRGERFGALYASPLRRARETAAALAPELGLEPVLLPGVTEFDAEDPVYVPLEEIKAADPAAWRELVQGGLYAGRDVAGFRRTVVETLEGVVERHPGQRAVVVCHGGVVNAWAAHVLGLERLLLFEPGYTSVSRFLAAGSGERSVASLNELGHLAAGFRPPGSPAGA